MKTLATSLDDVLSLFKKHGQDSYGEDVSQLEHALQCALLAQNANASDALVAAALMHDIGHFITGAAPEEIDAAIRHEQVGAYYLSSLFGSEVTEPIALHVMAKRYQCSTNPGYHQTLSAASQRSLIQQGGLLSREEVSRFETDPHFRSALQLRAWDDSGKIDNMELPTLNSFVPLLQSLLKPSLAAQAS